MAALNMRVHWALCAAILVVDVLILSLTIYQDKVHHVDPPSSQDTDMAAPIGWLGVCASIFIFGCYGICMKTPSVQEANCDCMVFQCYYSFAVALVSMLIWGIAGSSEGLTMDRSSLFMGSLFAFLWIVSGLLSFEAVQAIGYAVAPAIWIGVTIGVSFVWGVVAFEKPVHSWPGAVAALLLMLAGVATAAASNVISQRQEGRRPREVVTPSAPADDGVLLVRPGSRKAEGRSMAFGVLCAACLGLFNGSLMVPMSCFQYGCRSIGVQAYTGSALAPLAFLPSLALGILVVHPVMFLIYWGPSMCRGVMPQFHFAKVAAPGLLTGTYWGMGNFNAMYATVYLGQTVGYPLTQTCLILSGILGIVYFKEIKGAAAIGTFALGSLVILGGATLDALSC